MNLNKFDMVVLVVMPLAIIGMSFTMPALGLGSSDVGQNDIPEFDISADRFDFAGDFPDDPSDTSSGTVIFDRDNPSGGSSYVYLNETVELYLVNGDPDDGVPIDANLVDLRATELDNAALTDEGQEEVLEAGDWEVRVTLTEIRESDGGDVESFHVDYEVTESSPEEVAKDGFYAVLGTIIPGATMLTELIQQEGAMAGIATSLMYIVNIFMWFVGTTSEILTNFTFAFADLSLFFTELISWLFTTYSDLITGAPAWAAIFVSVPGILLSIVLGKLTFVLVSLLPTT